MDADALSSVVQKEVESEELFEAFVDAAMSSSDEEVTWGGSRKGRSVNKPRDFAAAHSRLVADYFNGRESVYSEADFERRFRMPREMFNTIHDRLMGKDPFVQKYDITGKKGIHPLVKLVACLRYIAYGDAYDREDENLRLAQSTLMSYVKQFCKLIIREFGPEFLNRGPTAEERASISEVMTAKGFPGCLASWDCKHFNWHNCPMRLAGQHQGRADGGKRTLILEAICDHRKYFWHLNFGDAGSLNDACVLEKSSIVGAMMTGTLSLRTEPYAINGNLRDWMYFLVDGIYPEWAIFVKTFSESTDPKRKRFAARQESVRKDIECAFGIIVKRFHVLKRPLRGWYVGDLRDLLQCCGILHNMIVVQRYGDLAVDYEAQQTDNSPFALFNRTEITAAQALADGVDLFATRVSAFDQSMQSTEEHFQLKQDLVEHIHTNNF